MPDLALWLLRLLRWPVAKVLDLGDDEEDREFLAAEVSERPRTWVEFMGNHTVRAVIWGITAGIMFVSGIVAIVADNETAEHPSHVVGTTLQVAFGICFMSAWLHGVVAYRAYVRSTKDEDGGPSARARVLWEPGNRYFVLWCLFFACGVSAH